MPHPLQSQLDSAVKAGQLTAPAAQNIARWLTEPRYQQYAEETAALVKAARWKELDDAFWTVIPFGTGGRRGKMYPVGCNAINDRTIGESAQGLADYVKAALPGGPHRCAIAYDTRHRSRHFAELCASILVANGFTVCFLDGYRSTPELSYCVRRKECSCGIMVTASHNPPSDNAVKVYWSSGVQVLPPHDRGIIDRVMNVDQIRSCDFRDAVAEGKVVFCQKEVDAAFIREVAAQGFPGPRTLRVLYSPLHGVGESAVCPALDADGFTNVEVFAPHREPNPDFPNVPGHVSNPELPVVFEAMIERARQTQADLILATDPDCDRLGAAAPLSRDTKGPWRTFTGNQIAALLADYVLGQRKKAGRLTPQHYLVKTLVTTEMVRRIGESYAVATHGNLHVGFKYIGQEMDAAGPDLFLLGCEESHGYLVGQYARDKDAAVAAMLLAELAAELKTKGKTLCEQLESLTWQHGCHVERLLNLTMTGSQGMARMKALMTLFRERPPKALGGLAVTSIRDYGNLTQSTPGGASVPLDAPQGDMVILDLSEAGNYIAVRPSGTEPKVKFYQFAFLPAEQLHLLAAAEAELGERLTRIEADLRKIADSV